MNKPHNTVPYITLHGPDGVGKTTTGRNVAAALNEHGQKAVFFDDWRTQSNWQNPFSNKELKASISKDSRDFIALQAAKAAVDSEVITELTDSGITVIKDRGILDIRADLQHRGFNPTDCDSPLIREPDLAILLMISETVRLGRLATKSDVQPADYQPNTPGNRLYEMSQSLHDQVTERCPDHGLIIDTDNLSLSEVVATIADVIR